MKKTNKYDEEELEILQAWEAGTLKPVSGAAKQIKAHQSAAESTFKKDQRLNIRISSRDLKIYRHAHLRKVCSIKHLSPVCCISLSVVIW